MMFEKKCARRLFIGMSVVLLATQVADATPFWVTYEADDAGGYPENQGWQRVYGNEHGPYAGGADRSLANGLFTIDSLSDDQIYDFYQRDLNSDPGPGEMFVAEWRTLIDPRSTLYDVDVAFARVGAPGYAGLELSPGSVRVMPGYHVLSIAPGVFHSYRFESTDMTSFSLWIDGVRRFDGQFEDITVLQAFVFFGDGMQGAQSLSQWDFFRYGVVPETNTLTAGVCVLTTSMLRRLVRRGAQTPTTSKEAS
jgi:hypothetical protein